MTLAPTPQTLADARRECGQQVRAADRERFLCSLFAAEPARGDLWALLAFNVEIARTRETVSAPPLGEIRLQWWREAIDGAYGGPTRPNHPVVQAVAAAVARAQPPRQRFERLLEARSRDLYDDPIADLAALEDYADATSGELSMLLLDVLGAASAPAQAAARHVGIAWALVGVVRALPFLARQRRLPLPADMMVAERVNPESVFAGRPEPGLRAVLRAVAARARHHLDAARASQADLSRAALPALLPARLAEQHLALLDAADFDVFANMPAPNPGMTAARLWWAHARGRY